MKVLFCALSSPGFLFPQIGLARVLRERGFECKFVCDPSVQHFVAEEGFERIPRGRTDGASFTLARWSRPLDVAMEVKHVEFALGTFDADVMVTDLLGLGPAIVAERRGIPLAVIGTASYLFPAESGPDDPGKVWNERETLGFLNEARRLLGFPAVEKTPTVHPLLGDVLLLQSVPEAHAAGRLPGAVRFVGALTWEPPRPLDGELQHRIDAARAAAVPILYVQPGRVFGTTGGWQNVVDALGRLEVLALISSSRSNEPLVSRSPNVIIREHISQGAVLPFAAGVITVGHTTPVLGALTHGVPLLLIPDGSGTYDTAEVCRRLHVAATADKDAVAADGAHALGRIEEFLADGDLRAAAARAAALYGRYRGAELAADEIARLVPSPNLAAVDSSALAHAAS